MKRNAWRIAVFAALCLAATQGRSHDSWLSPARGAAPPGQLMLELATGNRYPVQEFSQAPSSVTAAGCSDGAGTMPLRPLAAKPQWLELGAGITEGAQAISCWVELAPVETEIEPRVVEVYFNEIRTSAENRQTWAAMRARGLPWRESYRKFARIELAPAGNARTADLAAVRRPAGLDLEIVVLGQQAIAINQPLEFQVLRDGRPMAGFPVELVSERSALGIWRETDADGKLRHSLPFAGRWLLRGTDLRLSAQRAGSWESRFVTLAIDAR
jgi:hypothetical protein